MYKVKNKKYTRAEAGKKVIYRPGDVIEKLSKKELMSFPDNFESVSIPNVNKKISPPKVRQRGSWYVFPDGSKVLGKTNAMKKAEWLGIEF